MMSLFMPHVVSQRRNTLSVVKLYKSYKHFLPSFLAQHLSSSVYPPLDDVYDVTFTCLVCFFVFFLQILPQKSLRVLLGSLLQNFTWILKLQHLQPAGRDEDTFKFLLK